MDKKVGIDVHRILNNGQKILKNRNSPPFSTFRVTLKKSCYLVPEMGIGRMDKLQEICSFITLLRR